MADHREHKRVRLDPDGASSQQQLMKRSRHDVDTPNSIHQDKTREDGAKDASNSTDYLLRSDVCQRTINGSHAITATKEQGVGDSDLEHLLAPDGIDFPELSSAQLVCFGMLDSITIIHKLCVDRRGTLDDPIPVSLLRRPGSLQLEDNSGSTIGQLDSYYSKLFQTLLTCRTLSLQSYVVLSSHRNLCSKNVTSRGKGQLPEVTLSVVFYGPMTISGDFGEFLSRSSEYLQSPLHCDRNVPYKNPQSLSRKKINCPDTDELSTWDLDSQIETLSQAQDPAASLETDVAHPETEAIRIICTPLYSHQKQALSFMLASESNGSRLPGGLLADCMGLGKSLSIISLIANGYEENPCAPGRCFSTLLVVPSSLLHTWEKELTKHIQPRTLSWRIYHGRRRNKDVEQLVNHNVILTTYSIIVSEWKHVDNSQSPLFSAFWHRIVLDEAHDIRDSTTIRAKSVCALHAKFRWAVSGTPVQNRWEDLASLLQFLRVYPEHDTRSLVALLKQGQADTPAMNTLKSICLRRSKKVLSLPNRIDKVHKLDLDTDEAEAYADAKDSVIRSLQWPTESEGFRVYSNTLTRINALRQICNLGLHYQARMLEDLTRSDGSAQAIFDSMVSTGTASCSKCGNNLSMTYDERKSISEAQPSVSACGLLICAICVALAEDTPDDQGPKCQHKPTCGTWSVNYTREPGVSSLSTKPLPVKLRALQKDMIAIPTEDKSIVFSFWTSTLDLAGKALDEIGFSYSRLDDDKSIRVLLVSLGCGSTGLNLTVANHVFLMEPQWNPMLEDQALDRVHRIGQTKRVTTIRYVVNGTLEESIRHQQSEKRNIAEQAFHFARKHDHWIERVKSLLSN